MRAGFKASIRLVGGFLLVVGLSGLAETAVTPVDTGSSIPATAGGYTYEATIYGSQSPHRWIIGSHLFGQFVKRDASGKVVDSFDMSLMPQSLEEGLKHPLQLLRGILPAENLSLAETLKRTSQEGKIVGMVVPSR